jgi:acyl carrier protein
MDRHHLRALLVAKLASRLQRLGLTEQDLRADLDLVRGGILDSLGFVDLIAELETTTGKQVDLEQALDQKGATTLHGIMLLFS